MINVEICRSGFLESLHQVHAHVENSSGEIIFSSGVDFQFYPRSAIKPLQSMLLLESGAYRDFNLQPKHLAIASASHNGERVHTDLVKEWLTLMGLQIKDLNCGAHQPYNTQAIFELKKNGEAPTAIHNNCSGKHSGLLCVCKHLNLSVVDYHLPDHPLQQLLTKTLENYLQESLIDYGIDGCSIPAYRMSFHSFCRAFAKLAHQVFEKRVMSATQVYDAFVAHPQLTAGLEEYTFKLMEKNPHKILAKVGAEGVLIGAIPEKKLAIVVKALDGSERAAQFAFDRLLEKFTDISPILNPKLINWAGLEVGKIQVTGI
jgi:L-asparaginase II